MESPPHFNFIDVLRAPARALSAKKIFAMTFFICLGLVVYDIFTYIALAVQGENLGFVYSAYGLTPFFKLAFSNTIAQIVFIVGALLAVLCLMLGFMAVAIIDIEAVRGNRFLSAFKAIRFSFQRLPQILFSELAIIVFIAFIILLYVLLGLICRIPIIGDWLYSITFVMPGFIVAILTLFVFLVFQLSVVLMPAVAAAERTGESFSVILETFSTIIRQPVRWGLYTLYSLVAAKVCGFVYAYFCYRSVQFIGWATQIGGGDKMERLIKSGLSHIPVKSDFVQYTLNVFAGVDWSISTSGWTRGGTGEAAGYVMTVMLFLIFASIYGYMLSIIATAQARGYVAIRQIKDRHDISAEKPLFFEEEHANPPIEEEEGID